MLHCLDGAHGSLSATAQLLQPYSRRSQTGQQHLVGVGGDPDGQVPPVGAVVPRRVRGLQVRPRPLPRQLPAVEHDVRVDAGPPPVLQVYQLRGRSLSSAFGLCCELAQVQHVLQNVTKMSSSISLPANLASFDFGHQRTTTRQCHGSLSHLCEQKTVSADTPQHLRGSLQALLK